MKTRKSLVGIGLVALSMLGILLLRGGPEAPQPAGLAEPEAIATTPAPARAAAPIYAGAAAPEAPASAAPAPSPSAIRLVAQDKELYEEMRSVVEYYKMKKLPEHGPVHKVGDGVDSSDRTAKLARDTPFSRFRYEYEKHTSARLMDDLAWTDKELAQMKYDERSAKGQLAGDDKASADLLVRRRRAIVSILDQRGREEQALDRYQHVQVEYQDPHGANDGKGGG